MCQKTKTDCTPISLMVILLRAIVFKTDPSQSIRVKAPLLTSATDATEATHPDGCYSTPLPNVHLCSNQSVFQTTPLVTSDSFGHTYWTFLPGISLAKCLLIKAIRKASPLPPSPFSFALKNHTLQVCTLLELIYETCVPGLWNILGI